MTLTEDPALELMRREMLAVEPHPVLPWDFTAHEIRRADEDTLRELSVLWKERRQRIDRAKIDPLNFGFELSSWKDADALLARKTDILVSGANRSGKTEWAAKRCVQTLVSKPGSTVWCLCETNETSVRKDGQQQIVWKYLPNAWKAMNGKHRSGIVYSPKNKFADNAFVTPSGGECRFMNYQQDIKVVEGPPIDLFWCDELVPIEWVTTLRGRIVDRKGKGIVTFTPIYGFNDTVGEYTERGTVREWRDCAQRPDVVLFKPGAPGKVPYLMDSLDARRGAIFFQAQDNPFISYKELVQQWGNEHSSTDTILQRLHGVARRKAGNKFPKFGKAHIITQEAIPKEGTDWFFCDFAWSRPWAMLWLRVKRVGDRRFIYAVRDWPEKQTYGEWVLPSSKKKDGDRGPAQNALGFGTQEYKDVMATIETELGLSVFARKGDPRSGKAPALTADHGGTDIIALMSDIGVFIEPAKGLDLMHGINGINDWMSYDEDKPVDALNQPSLYIAEDCEQLIDCLRVWTGADGQKGASKDFVDLLRMAADEDVEEMQPEMFQVRGGFSY